MCPDTIKENVDSGVHALDVAKALIDRGFHPPTVYFPTTVHDAMMIEPTETESKETLDAFIEAMIDIAEVAKKDPEKIKASPLTTPVCRPDDTAAAKNLDLACCKTNIQASLHSRGLRIVFDKPYCLKKIRRIPINFGAVVL